MFIKNNSAWIQIDIACAIFEFSKSSYYEWLSNYKTCMQRVADYEILSSSIVKLFANFKSRYGSRRITDELNKAGIKVNRKKVMAIMHKNNLVPTGYKKFKVTTTDSNHKQRVFDNLLKRNFKAARPNQVFVSDITYIRTNEGWLYLATVIDLFSRKLVGYEMGNRMTKDLVIRALQKALKARNYPKGIIVHSDRGSQYASNEYKRLLKQHGLLGSMNKKADCWDNAVAESFFATLKKEYVYQTAFKTRVEAHLGIFDYIETWYNKERIHSTLGGVSPNQFEQIYHHLEANNLSLNDVNNINNQNYFNVLNLVSGK